ncbi:MAG: right-handed parallel beta-helix repeat-containing protein [Mollicutes bacterium]|nr:right-handed parallel beta-helix repeat-containing protein [Mollicutes bacterium]
MIKGISEDILKRVYDFSEMTNEELRCKFFQKLEECIDLCNNTSDILEWVKNEGLENEVIELLTLWEQDGTLANLINIDIFNNLKTELESKINKKVDSETYETAVNTINSQLNTINSQLNTITQENKKIVTLIDSVDNIQTKINNATDQIKFVKGEYTLTDDLYLKSNIEYDGCGSTLNLNDCSIILNTGVSNILFKNFIIKGSLKYTKITELLENGTKIKCENNVFTVGDYLGCSNYGKTDKPYARVIAFDNGYYSLDTPISTDGHLLNTSWGAVVGNFQWTSLINGQHNTNNITIDNCVIENARGYAIALPNSDNINILNTTIRNNGLDFCLFSAESSNRFNLLFDNCILENSIDFGKQGIVITKQDNIYYKNIKINNCTFRNISESAISLGYAQGHIQNLIISGCEFYNNILFGIHCCGNYLTIKDNIIQGSQAGIRIADITSETYGDDSYYSDIFISNNNISSCRNGIIMTQVKKSSGGKHNPKNVTINDNIVYVEYSAIETCGININVIGNKTYSEKNNGSPYYASSLFINGSENKSVKVLNNFFDGECNVVWTNTFNMLIKNNTFNSLNSGKTVKIRSMDSPNLQTNMLCVVDTNTIYSGSKIILSTNDGNDKTEFKNNLFIKNGVIYKIPYMKGKGARYEADSNCDHWLSNTDNSWVITKDNYFECNGKYGYIASDGTLKVTTDITTLS